MGGENPVVLLERERFRRSSFASPSSPWQRRRRLLSRSMLMDELHLVYEIRQYDPRTGLMATRYLMALRCSQGFAWNQDLFASHYQQMGAWGSNGGSGLMPGLDPPIEVVDVFLSDEET